MGARGSMATAGPDLAPPPRRDALGAASRIDPTPSDRRLDAEHDVLATLSPGTTIGSWKMVAMPQRRASLGDWNCTSWPCTRILPIRSLSCRPDRMRITVDFPALSLAHQRVISPAEIRAHAGESAATGWSLVDAFRGDRRVTRCFDMRAIPRPRAGHPVSAQQLDHAHHQLAADRKELRTDLVVDWEAAQLQNCVSFTTSSRRAGCRAILLRSRSSTNRRLRRDGRPLESADISPVLRPPGCAVLAWKSARGDNAVPRSGLGAVPRNDVAGRRKVRSAILASLRPACLPSVSSPSIDPVRPRGPVPTQTCRSQDARNAGGASQPATRASGGSLTVRSRRDLVHVDRNQLARRLRMRTVGDDRIHILRQAREHQNIDRRRTATC